MMLMRIRELNTCEHHNRMLVVLDDVDGRGHLAFYADAEDARRLARELARGPRACHPVFDFIMTLLRSWHATPVRVVLEGVDGDGIGALVWIRQGEIESSISCYPPDALTIALRTGVPIYATPGLLGARDTVAEERATAEWLERVRPNDFEAGRRREAHEDRHPIAARGRRGLLGMAVVATAEDQRDRGRQAILSMAGCYLVDYSYVETHEVRPGYVRDPRVYDVNREQSIKEWIWAEAVSDRRIWIHRALFAVDLDGTVRPGSVIRHQSEDWEHDAPFLYDFVAPQTWHVRDLRSTPGLWTRRVTNLDDGLRYQCAARWRTDTAYPEWSCANYAPIPGRETRDMSRTDYHALERHTRIVAYGTSWLERQDNVKMVDGAGGRTALARETGKNWYVRLPESECAAGQAFARPRLAFWALLRETWAGVLTGSSPFVERTPPGEPPRFVKMYEVEAEYGGRDLSNPDIRSAARQRILEIIEAYRDR